MTDLKWLVVVVAVGYLGGLVAVFLMQRTFLFPIPQTIRTAPDTAGFPEAEEHILTTADGERVIVWHVPAKPGHQVVIYFPGNGDFLAARVGRLRAITSDGTGLVALSYRGYAGSSGKPSEQGVLQDAAAAYAFTAARYGVDRLMWYETHATAEAAIRREKQIKEWKRDWKINLIERDNPHWIDLYPTLGSG